MAVVNRSLLLRTRPAGLVTPDMFLTVETRLKEQLDADQVLVKVDYLTVSPKLYAVISGEKERLGETVPAYGVGTVIRSGTRQFAKGDQVVGFLGTQEYAILYVREVAKLPAGANPIDYLTRYGLEAITAYLGITKLGKIKPGCLVAVSGASGALGSIAVQIAKHMGAQVLCITSSDAKCQYLKEVLKADICINYNATQNLSAELQQVVGKGIDLFIDTVGGQILNSVLRNIKTFGRVILCGSLSDLGIPQPMVQVA